MVVLPNIHSKLVVLGSIICFELIMLTTTMQLESGDAYCHCFGNRLLLTDTFYGNIAKPKDSPSIECPARVVHPGEVSHMDQCLEHETMLCQATWSWSIWGKTTASKPFQHAGSQNQQIKLSAKNSRQRTFTNLPIH